MIYKLDERIERKLSEFYDPLTGELLDGVTDNDMLTAIAEAETDHETLLDSIASEIKNLTAEAESIKKEKQALAKRQSVIENRVERTKRLLAYLLGGEKWKNGRHNVTYRKSEELVIDDDFVEWASLNAPGLLKLEPEVRKTDVRNAIKRGTVFEFAHIEQKNNIQIK